jgi:NTE family protein
MTATDTSGATNLADCNPSVTEHALNRYFPLPKEERRGVALCLSGGGYRAALFHLGAMRRLNELGILSSVDTITSVSGGSIASAFVAAHLIERLKSWPVAGEVVADWETGVAEPLRRLMATNIRTGAALARLRPLNWLNSNAASDTLAAKYAAATTRRSIGALPPRPRFIYCATDLRFRSQWVVDSGINRVGDEKIGYQTPIPDSWTVARAAAASSCFPVLFAPRRVKWDPASLVPGTYDEPDRLALGRQIQLSDGGVYDNLGLEPVWQDHAVVLSSDGGPSLKAAPEFGPLWRGLRYVITFLEQVTELRKRWLIANFARGDLCGAFWGMASLPTNYDKCSDVRVYPDPLIKDVISQFRIDLDACSNAEMAVLENHGYVMAELAIQCHAPQLVRRPSPPRAPYPEYMDQRAVTEALAKSSRYALFGRGRWW